MPPLEQFVISVRANKDVLPLIVISDPFHVHISEVFEGREEQSRYSIPSVNTQDVTVVWPSNTNPTPSGEQEETEANVESEIDTFVVGTECRIAGVLCVWDRLVNVQRIIERDEYISDVMSEEGVRVDMRDVSSSVMVRSDIVTLKRTRVDVGESVNNEEFKEVVDG